MFGIVHLNCDKILSTEFFFFDNIEFKMVFPYNCTCKQCKNVKWATGVDVVYDLFQIC